MAGLPATTPSSVLLRIQNLERRADSLEVQYGKMMKVGIESRDAAVRTADQVVELMGQMRDLKTAVETRCDDRCGTLRRDVNEMRTVVHGKANKSDIDDLLEIPTGVMNRDELINSREYLKQELENLKAQLSELADAEIKRQRAERDKAVAEQAVKQANLEKLQVQGENEAATNALRRERIKAHAGIIVAALTVLGGIITAAIMHWGG